MRPPDEDQSIPHLAEMFHVSLGMLGYLRPLAGSLLVNLAIQKYRLSTPSNAPEPIVQRPYNLSSSFQDSVDDIGASFALMATLMVLIAAGSGLFCRLQAGGSSATWNCTVCVPPCLCLLFLFWITGGLFIL